jgi:hypothetical protein
MVHSEKSVKLPLDILEFPLDIIIGVEAADCIREYTVSSC